MASSIGEQYSRLSSVNAIQKLGFLINDPQESAQLKSEQNNPNPHLSHFGNAPSSANSTQIDLKNQIKNLLEVIGEGPIDTVPQNPVRNPRNSDRSSSPNLNLTQQDHTPQAKTNKIQHTRSPSTDNSAIKRHIEYIHSLSAATVKQNGSPVKKEETFESSRSWYGQRAIRKDNGLNKSTDLAVYVDRGRVSAEKQPMTRWQKYEEQTREPLFNIKSNNFLTPIFNTNHRSQSNLHTHDALYNISRESGSIQAFYKASEEPQGNVEVNKTEKKKQRDITPTFRGNRSYSPMNGTNKEESLVFSLLNHTRPESKATSELGMMKEEKNKYLIEGDVYYVSTNKVMSHSPMRSQKLTYNFNEKEPEDKKSNKLTAQQNKISPVKNPTVEKSETASPNKTSPNKVSLNQQQENEKMEMMKYYKELQRKTASEESAPAKTDRSIYNQPPRPISKLGDKYYEDVPATQQRNQSSSSISYPKSNYDFGDPNANRQLPLEPRGNSLVQNGTSKTGSQSGIKLSSAMTSPERDDAKLNSNLNKGRQRDVSNGTRIPSNQFSYDRVEESEQNYSNGGATKNDYSYSVSKSPQKNGAVNDKKAESVEKGNREMKNKTFNDTFGKEDSSASKKVEFVGLQQNSSPAKQLGQPQTRAEANVNPRNTQPVPTLEGQKMASEKELKEKQESKEEERKKAQQRNEMLRTVESMLKEEKKSSKDTKPEKKPETKAEPQKPAAKTEIPDITSIYGAPEKKKVVAKTQPNNVTNNPTAASKTDSPQKTNDSKQPADNKPTNVPADTKQNGGQAASKDATSQQKAQTATGTTSKTTAAAQDGKAAETQKKSDLNKVEIDKETLAKLEAALAKSTDPKIQMLMELIKKDPEKFNKVLDYVEHPEKMKAESQTDTKKGPENKRASILENKRGSILENKRASILAPKRQSILIAKQETTTQNKTEGSVLSKVDESEEKAWKEKEAADKAEIENLKQYLTYYQQYEGLYQQQQQMLYEKQMMIENLQKQPGSIGTSTNVSSSSAQTGGGSTQLTAPNLLGTQSGSTLQAPNLLGGGSTNTLPPPNLLGGGGGSTNTLPPPNLLGGGGGSTNTLPPPNLLGGSGSSTLPPPNLLGGGSANTLPPPNLLGGGGSNTLPPPNLLGGSGSNTLPPPNLLGGGSTNMLPPPNLLGGGGSNTLPPPNLLGGGSGGLPPPNLLGNKGSGGLPPPNLLGGGSGGLPPPNLLGGGSGGLPPPNLLGKPGGLPPPNLLGGGPGGLPPPNLLGKPGGLPPPNLLGGGPGGLPPPNLLGKPGGMPPPNLLGGGPGGLQPPNLGLKPPTLGGPPNLLGGPPNLLGGSGGLGGPPKLNLGGPPNLSLNKGPTLGGPPNLNLSTTSQPKKNYKPIFWEAVPPQKFNDTIWASAYQEQVEDLKFNDIEDMFLNAPAKPGGGGGGGGTVEQKKPEVISLISDSKKAYNMNIMISKFKKYSNDQMRVAVETMDPDILTVDACSTLLPFCPEKEEISAASTYEGEMSGLDPASQFIVAVHKIPRLQLRFKNCIFKGDFDDKLDAMAKDVEVFRNGCVTLTSNENFRKFLKIALNIGNTLNAGTARGGAYGFKLSSLVAFMNTKGNKPNMTLLSYIVQQVYSQKPEWLDFTSEFDKLNDVSKLNIDNLVKDISGLKTQVQNLKGTIDLASKSNPADSGYVNCFQPFYESAWPKVSACETKANETKTLYVQTAKFLGEDDESLKKKTSEEFFAIFVNINNSIKKTVKDEEERKKKEARGKK